ncbi:hypothetical protein [Tropicimonas sp. IMCC34043]|uniref:hypothetical protein n=1 Tax=Tropicimonas sp. IMCC34043 TaxID=2248760 RepID=UPI000E26066A|nr:hypothetical protein [Tropicimonas sp. IMCC34043]
MNTWTNVAEVVPWGEAAAPAYERPFPLWASVATLEISTGGSVEIQTRDHTGAWVARQTVAEANSTGIVKLDVAATPSLRINPISGAHFRVTFPID